MHLQNNQNIPGHHSQTNIFPHSSHSTINGGIYSAGRDVNIYHSSIGTHERGIELLLARTVTGAFYNAAERGDPPKCHPRTREAILKEIKQWIKSPRDIRHLILWLNGPAGAGKSAIAQTIAEVCAEEGLLAASFFFFRTNATRNNSSSLIPTISYQLALSIPRLRMYIGRAVERNSAIFDLTMRTQLDELVLKPVLEAVSDGSMLHTDEVFPELVVLDGLDECKKDTEQREILDLLKAFATQLKNIPLIFLVASRPEFTIRTKFNHPSMGTIAQGMVLDNTYRPDQDIKIFLQDTFNDIRDTHPDGPDLPQPWPSRKQLVYLVNKASGQFIYAATVARYVKSPRHDPSQRLSVILTLAEAPVSDAPFAQLDALYIHILSSVKDLPKVMDILTFIILRSFAPANTNSLEYLDQQFGYMIGDSRRALIDMYALIEIPVFRGYNSTPRIYHASLADFLMDRSRSGRFFIDPQMGHINLAIRSLNLLNSDDSQMDAKYLLRHFIHHCEGVEDVPEELCQVMKSFNMRLVFSKCSMWYKVEMKDWNTLFRYATKWVSVELSETLAYQLSLCILGTIEIYPEPLRSTVSTLVRMMSSIYLAEHPVCLAHNIHDIFSLLLHSLNISRSDSQAIKNLDDQGLGCTHTDYLSTQYVRWALKNIAKYSQGNNQRHLLHITPDSNVRFIRQLLGFLSERQYYLNSLPDNFTNFDTTNNRRAVEIDMGSNCPISVIPLYNCDLGFVDDILQYSVKDVDLATFLRSCATQWIGEGSFLPSISRWNLVKYSLQYIERCRDILPDDFIHFPSVLTRKYLGNNVQWTMPEYDRHNAYWCTYDAIVLEHSDSESSSSSSSDEDGDSSMLEEVGKADADSEMDTGEDLCPIQDQEWVSIQNYLNGTDGSDSTLRRRVREIYDDRDSDDQEGSSSNRSQSRKKARVVDK